MCVYSNSTYQYIVSKIYSILPILQQLQMVVQHLTLKLGPRSFVVQHQNTPDGHTAKDFNLREIDYSLTMSGKW